MVGVCIKYNHENYGGILQAYATVSYLEKQKLDYALIRYTRKRTIAETLKDLPRLFNAVWFNSRYEGLQRKLSLKLYHAYRENNTIRMNAFSEFKEWAFSVAIHEYVGYRALCDGAKNYSAVITGSDQLWSPAGLPTNFFNLMFVPEDVLKIAIASSFGVQDIPWYQTKRTSTFLRRIEYISMRENRGSEIVEELTRRNVPTILDPVFFLSREEWLERIPNERLIEGNYVFAYFLGTNSEFRKRVTEFARQNKLKIVTLRHMDQYVREDESFGDEAPYDVDPRRFLNLLRNATYVFTDSFHGTAFSIINHKQFVVFDRYRNDSRVSKNSRIETLCYNFDLENRRYSQGQNLRNILVSDIDYNEVEICLNRLRETTDHYLKQVLDEIRIREKQFLHHSQDK